MQEFEKLAIISEIRQASKLHQREQRELGARCFLALQRMFTKEQLDFRPGVDLKESEMRYALTNSSLRRALIRLLAGDIRIEFFLMEVDEERSRGLDGYGGLYPIY